MREREIEREFRFLLRIILWGEVNCSGSDVGRRDGVGLCEELGGFWC